MLILSQCTWTHRAYFICCASNPCGRWELLLQVPTRLAVSINAVPTKLARAINLLAEGDENKDLKIGDVFPKAAAAPEAS